MRSTSSVRAPGMFTFPIASVKTGSASRSETTSALCRLMERSFCRTCTTSRMNLTSIIARSSAGRAALEKLNANKVETIAPSVSLDPELDCDQQLSVGATALCASILNANGMLKNVGTVLDNNPELTMACINLAMHSAITTDKTYLADKESTQQKFIGYGCLSSPRASEFFQRIGNEQTLSLKMAKACATHLEDGEILALDGTRVDCNSENISLAAVGKKKDGSYGPQINVSLVINVKNGSPICYRAYAGNISDISTLDDLRKMWTDIGISEKSPLILMDRGYPNQEEFVNLDRDGYRFLIGAKTSMKLVKDVIDQKNCEFYDQKTYLRQQRCYGVKSKTAVSCDGHRMNIHSYVFRSPSKEKRMNCWTGWRLSKRVGLGRKTACCLRQTERIWTFLLRPPTAICFWTKRGSVMSATVWATSVWWATSTSR